MPPHLLVLPSPFLGPAPYERLVAALSRRGHPASVAPSPDPPVAADLVAAWTELAREHDDVVLVPHSNAGYLAPAVAGAAGDASVVFVDAAVPAVEDAVTRLAPPALRDELARLAGADGRLPRWTRWWSRDELAGVLPDPWLDRVDAVVPQVPLAYVDSEVPVPAGWAAGHHAYLALGPTYAAELAVAVSHGWPHRTLAAAGHLHPLLEPDDTAAAVAALAASAGRARRGSQRRPR